MRNVRICPHFHTFRWELQTWPQLLATWLLVASAKTHAWWYQMSLLSLQGTDMETMVQYSSELCIPKHKSCHNDLTPFSDLMRWLKEVDQTVFRDLCQVLIQCSHPRIHPPWPARYPLQPLSHTCTRLGISCEHRRARVFGILGMEVFMFFSQMT